MTRRMKAAMAAIAYEHPKLSATYAVNGDRDFAEQMREIARRSGRSMVIDGHTHRTSTASATSVTPKVLGLRTRCTRRRPRRSRSYPLARTRCRAGAEGCEGARTMRG
jgi:hypothetical protein